MTLRFNLLLVLVCVLGKGSSTAMAQPSASGATTLKEVTGTNELGWEVPFPAGSSFVEPGVTPAVDMTFTFDTWDEFAEVCGLTRLWSGVHFEDSVKNIEKPCTTIGQAAAAYVTGLVAGEK